MQPVGTPLVGVRVPRQRIKGNANTHQGRPYWSQRGIITRGFRRASKG
jgi:hypothetical protein